MPINIDCQKYRLENYRIVGCEEVTPIWGYNNLKVVPLYWLKHAISGRYEEIWNIFKIAHVELS